MSDGLRSPVTQNDTQPNWSVTPPVRVGLVGTGYVATRRAEALLEDDRAHPIAVAGHTPEKTEAFCKIHGAYPLETWQQLVGEPSLDVAIVSGINRDRGEIVRAALEAGKHVITEYPLSLDPAEAKASIEFAKARGQLLHVEHIELLGGLHQAMRQVLPEIGTVFYARYVTLSPQRPAERRWSYHRELFGFPLSAALSRIHRFTDLFGTVEALNCRSRFWDTTDGYYSACLCAAQLKFSSGLIAEITYGKGEAFWNRKRTFELHGDRGTLVFEGDTGTLVRGEEKIPIEFESRRGLLAKDTRMALDYLLEGTPMYVSPEASLYALQIADAARIASETEETYKF
ncbi:MAG: Gfo/Idh/MocA family oxidoreductase [Cyanobacteriota bacterium]|nr:Gfo/Idh/MocA family oxidoreductase [Cyanobacteriota bacterium]